MKPNNVANLALLVAVVTYVVVYLLGPTTSAPPQPPGISLAELAWPGDLHEQTRQALAAAPQRRMTGPGLVGAEGGTRVKAQRRGEHHVLLPIPQVTDAQAPIVFSIFADPPEVATAYRLLQRNGSNIVLHITLEAEAGQEIALAWSAVLLVGDALTTELPAPDGYRAASDCVQSDAKQIIDLADALWNGDGRESNVADFAVRIQQHIAELKQEKQPRSLDALSVLDSKANWICTANANLGAALLRAKNYPARTLAVIPTTSLRLEMHRIVEYFDDGRWNRFDPSALHAEVPMKPWLSVVMATTTADDETAAMEPRWGASPGGPYGHELEFLARGLTFSGNDFFWTEARPLAEFAVPAAALNRARDLWQKFLSSGKLSPAQIAAAKETEGNAVLDALSAGRQ